MTVSFYQSLAETDSITKIILKDCIVILNHKRYFIYLFWILDPNQCICNRLIVMGMIFWMPQFDLVHTSFLS